MKKKACEKQKNSCEKFAQFLLKISFSEKKTKQKTNIVIRDQPKSTLPIFYLFISFSESSYKKSFINTHLF
jgi:hypothetical protein